MSNVLFNPAFQPVFDSILRYLVVWGGAGSGKSHAVAQKIVERCTRSERHKFLVVRKFKTTIEGSVFTLIKQVINDFGIGKHVSINNTKMTFTFSNGNEIITTGLDDSEKLKSIHGITGIWCEEFTELEHEEFNQLDLRLRGRTDSYKQIIGTFNPISIDHWIHERFFEKQSDKVFTMWSNYKMNLFLDDQYIEVLEQEVAHDPNMRRIYVEGKWGRIRLGSDFYACFDMDKNVKPISYNIDLPIHISWDFNISPHMTASLWHIYEVDSVYNVGCFDILALENPLNSTQDVCDAFQERYPEYEVGIYVYGDASGRARSTTSKVHNYDIIEHELKSYMRNWSMRVPKRNPLFNTRRDFINRCLGGGYKDINVFFDPSCDLMITDMINVLEDATGKKHKKMVKNKAGVLYEKYGHASDTMDYLLCSAFETKFRGFGRKT